MKKTLLRALALTLVALTLTLSLVACGGKSGGYTFKTSAGVEVTIGAAADKTIEKLGTYQSMSESASCGGIPGNDRVYTYVGFRVKTTPVEGGDIVCQIELTDDSVKTPEGVYVGMSAEDAKAAMGGTPEVVGENLIYTADGMKLQILCRGGSVSGVLYVTE